MNGIGLLSKKEPKRSPSYLIDLDSLLLGPQDLDYLLPGPPDLDNLLPGPPDLDYLLPGPQI